MRTRHRRFACPAFGRKTNSPFCCRSLQRRTQTSWSAVALDGQNNRKQPCSKILAEDLVHVSPDTGVYSLRQIRGTFRRVYASRKTHSCRGSLAPSGHLLLWTGFEDLNFIQRARATGPARRASRSRDNPFLFQTGRIRLTRFTCCRVSHCCRPTATALAWTGKPVALEPEPLRTFAGAHPPA